MAMNSVIQERRKELGLTQEQIAEYLNVSVPAVSKWETGITCPDVMLLPTLARLLKIDMNKLFCFHEELTPQEIQCFCKEIESIFKTDGIAKAFDAAEQKLHEYPHSEELLYTVAIQMDGCLILSELSYDEKTLFEDKVISLYKKISKSDDEKNRNLANYMIASKYIRQNNYDKAQEALDLISTNNNVFNIMTDKILLQATVYQHQDKAEKASEELERTLLMYVNKIITILYKMVEIELILGEKQIAESISNKIKQVVDTFDQWDYSAYVAPLGIAANEKNTEKCINVLRSMLETLLVPWDASKSPLFHRVLSKSQNSIGQKEFLLPVIREIERSPYCEFLQNCDEYKTLITEYREKINNLK